MKTQAPILPISIATTYEAVTAILSLPPVDYGIQNVENLEQLKQLWKLDMVAYQDCTIPFNTFKKWWCKYPFGSKIYLEGQTILASIGIYPLEATVAQAFMRGEIKEGELVPLSLKDCQRSPQHYWYASGILLNEVALRADPQRLLRDSPIKPLLKTGLSLWLDSGHVSYPVTLFALGLTPQGMNMLNRFGLKESRPASEMPDGCPLYEATLTSPLQVLEVLRGRALHDSSRV